MNPVTNPIHDARELTAAVVLLGEIATSVSLPRPEYVCTPVRSDEELDTAFDQLESSISQLGEIGATVGELERNPGNERNPRTVWCMRAFVIICFIIIVGAIVFRAVNHSA